MIRTLLSLVVFALVAQADRSPLQISQRARALTAGEVVLLEVRSRTGLAKVEAMAFGAPVTFFQVAPDRWEGLAAIDLATRPGRHTAQVTARTDDGATLTAAHTIAVVARTFAVRRLTVAPRFADPPKELLPRIERERRRTETIFGRTTPERFWSGPFVAPVPGAATSSFGRRSIVNGQPRSPHTGTDFQAADGTRVVAPNHGRVVLADELYFAGKTVIIDHGAGLYSYLAHLSRIAVSEGDDLKRGDEVGLSGSTGRITGPHLHWSMRLGAARIDPLSLVFLTKRPDVAEPEQGV